MKYYNLCLFLIVVINITKSEKASYLKTKKYQEDDSKSSPAEPRTYKGYCFTKINNHFFDLNPLNSLKSYHLKTKDGQLINFNFCSNVETSCVNNEAMIVSKEECKRFSDVSNQEKTWSLIETPRKPSVLTVTLSEGDVCEKRNDKIIKYTTVFEITCDRTVDEIIIINDKEFDPKKCFNVIKIKSKYGCSRGKFQAWWNQFGVPKQSIAVMLIIIGLYFIIFGETCWHINSILINSAILGLIINSVFSLFMKTNIGLCMLFGVIIAFTVFSFKSLNGITLGIVVGYLVGNLFYNILVKIIVLNPQVLYWSNIIVCTVCISIFGGFMDEYMVCVATSLVGAYSLVRGVSVFSGGYPDETYVMKLINMREYSQFGRVFGPLIYMYIGGIVLMTVVGCMIQIQIKDNHLNVEYKSEQIIKKEQSNTLKEENKLLINKDPKNEDGQINK